MGSNILIVDDSKFMRRLLGEMVENHGYRVIGEAQDGKEAVKQYKELSPDLVILNLIMPVMEGLGCLRELKKWDLGAKVIICSALSNRETVSRAFQAGATDFIAKPVHEFTLIKKMERIFAGGQVAWRN